MAYFSDSEQSTDNNIESGEIALDAGNDSINNAAVRVGEIAPGEGDTKSLNLSNTGSIDGFLSLDFGVPGSRNDLTEVLEVEISIGGTTIRKGTFGTVFDGEGEWSNADIPLNASNTKTLEFKYTLPTGTSQAGAQGETAQADIDILLNQQEEAFADLVVAQPSGAGNVSTIQDGVDSIPEGGVLLVRGGTYQENVNVNKAGVKIAAKNSGSVTIAADATVDNAALRVPGFDDVTVDGLRVTHDNSVQADNAEKTGIRGNPINNSGGSGPNNLTVRNCVVEGIQSEDTGNNTGAIRANGISVDMEPTSFQPSTVSNVTIENNVIQNIITTGSTDNAGDSRAKGIATNGDVDRAAMVFNEINNIGSTTGDDPSVGAGDTATGGTTEGTEKPRGITITEDSNGDGLTNFTILDNLIQDVEGLVGQPAIFVGGTNALGDHEVYNNEFQHPVDNLSSGTLRLRENTWVNDADGDGLPELVPPDQDEDGGNLIDRGSGAYDTTYAI